MVNATAFPDERLLYAVHAHPPFYHTDRPSLFASISDENLSLFAPIIAYWAYCLFFHALDSSSSKIVARYRIHESAEVKARNLVTHREVIIAVFFQQVLQTLLGLFLMHLPPPDNSPLTDINTIARGVESGAKLLLGERLALSLMQSSRTELVRFVYWWAIPAAQIIFGFFFIDTWQYFLHRAFHVNKFLYRHFHSWHHRLYVPYAFGALYNHPLEGFLLDSLGTGIAHSVSLLSVRQAILLFTFSTLKTVDDHCGYRLPWDPLQLIFSNNADYHDIHHQVVGIKHNFSQPFFIHWDVLLGTRMTRKTMEEKRRNGHTKTS